MLKRPRRNRKNAAIRSMVEETKLGTENIILPLFLKDGKGLKEEIKSLPGNYRWSLDLLMKELDECLNLGIKIIDLFPCVDDVLKDRTASYSYSENNFYLDAIRKITETFPELVVMTDVALDPYSSDGHDGLFENGIILNDASLPILNKMALAQAQAGASIIGPSDMMDGRVGSIRNHLDKNGFNEVSIMSYSAKYASSFYNPFREALNSAPKTGDKKTYQMNPANRKEAILEAELDIAEGADFIMVKPALCYLDIIHQLNEKFTTPVTAYNVSGECAMIHAAAQNGWIDLEAAILETLTSIRRAGASGILTYFAKDFARISKS